MVRYSVRPNTGMEGWRDEVMEWNELEECIDGMEGFEEFTEGMEGLCRDGMEVV